MILLCAIHLLSSEPTARVLVLRRSFTALVLSVIRAGLLHLGVRTDSRKLEVFVEVSQAQFEVAILSLYHTQFHPIRVDA